MWIRSQCKTLLIATTEIFTSSGCRNVIQCYSSEKGTRYNLGEYGTEERAMEVLEDMQQALFYQLIGQSNIYQMPQE